MFEVIGCITAHHDFSLVILAAVMSFFAAYTATELMSRARVAKGRQRQLWTIGTGFVSGGGIWATHFILMLSYRAPVHVSYDLALTALSAIAGIALSILSFAITVEFRRPDLGGIILASAIAAAHFVGMSALRGPLHMSWDPDYIAASLALGLAMAPPALRLAYNANNPARSIIAAAFLTAAICSLHFTAMTAADITLVASLPQTGQVVEPDTLALAVAIIVSAFLALGFAGALFDRHRAKRLVAEATALRTHITQLEESKRELESALRTLSAYKIALDENAIVAITDAKGTIAHVNDKFCSISGYTRDELLGNNHRILNSGTHGKAFFVDMWRRIARGETFHAEICNRSKTGALYWVETTIVALPGPDERPERYVSIRYDITAQKKAAADAAQRRVMADLISNMQSEAISSGSISLALNNALGQILEILGGAIAFVQEFGGADNDRTAMPAWVRAKATLKDIRADVPSDTTQVLMVGDAHLSDAHRETITEHSCACWTYDPSAGEPAFIGFPIIVGNELVGLLTLDGSCRTTDNDWSGFAAFVCAVGDLLLAQRESDRRMRAEENAQILARHDALTGLGNRRYIMEEFEGRIDHPDAQFALMLIDLDRFKPINDLHGHSVGDQVLQIVSQRMREAVQGDCAVVRLGGDEFAVLTPPEGNEQGVRRLADRMLKVLSSPIEIGDLHVSIGASIGVALYPKDARTAQQLLHLADAAMYRAKKSRGEVQFFDMSMDESIRARASLESDLRAAVETDEIIPYFQPVVSLANGKVVGHEVLARWKHHTRGFVSPSEFIPLAEDAGLIDEIFWALLRKACVEHLRSGLDTQLSVNISARQTRDPLFAQRLLKALTSHGFPARRLEVEVTETAMIGDTERARTLLLSLRNLGVRIALDDFGTGYSSLVLLRDLPIDKIKIDRSFVSGLGVNANATIVDAILAMATALNLVVTAEGIEDATTAALLHDRGCQYGQGYLFGRATASPAGDTLGASLETQPARRAAHAPRTRRTRPGG